MERIEAFDFEPGRKIGRKYEIVSFLGRGWEGEVYKIREVTTGIERAAKVFFPYRNVKNKTSDAYARKLHKLRECSFVIKYHHQENMLYRNQLVTALISEYVEGDLLSAYLARLPGKRLPLFQGIHLLHALAAGVESIHHHREYHGDLHTDNVIVCRLGLAYELKVLDFFHWGDARSVNMQDDICNLIRIFYDSIGGQRFYGRQPPEVKAVCCGLKRSLILRKFPSATQLRIYLERRSWERCT